MQPVVKAENLSKWYGNILGISDITLAINPGIKGLLGPNGAGKSTFLKLVSGQLKPNIGRITVFGEPVFANHKLFSRIGFCPEHASLYTDISGWEQVLFFAKLQGCSKKEAIEKTERALAKVGLLEQKNKIIRSYSFGMQQRLKIAVSIVNEPELLILDEPLRGVDPLWRFRIVQIIKENSHEGKTIIVASHNLPEIEAMTNEIVLIHQGKIFAEGDIYYIRDLIDTHPHMISITTPHFRKLASLMIQNHCIETIQFDQEHQKVTFKTNNRDHFYAVLTGTIVENQIEIEEITAPDDNLQAVFDYLIAR
ncbi:MAG: hypothetical protein A2Y62_04335 [Candidatus Fischerbacteria bacterium RBG_13_37_8]|uniref:ABC transporter domain-containing protein n=1 Tax=Candidatus Fischerbacteria bacterium RBG_13_37_8 TaxID=1817863 RepID=A0A1F5VGC9_9BACT|nr:MAG: hypothetical protein A2Y62_04335 [Candidatus Fischerbacteria bacterium RBG_13_37_8]